MIALKVLALVLLVSGVAVVFSARWLVRRYKLDAKAGCSFESEMGEEELKQYKFNKAVVNVKLAGMLVALPGFIIIVFVFK